VPRRCAAFAMLPASTTDMSTRTSCSFRRRSMRSIGPMMPLPCPISGLI
jgi:hypothetical protein